MSLEQAFMQGFLDELEKEAVLKKTIGAVKSVARKAAIPAAIAAAGATGVGVGAHPSVTPKVRSVVRKIQSWAGKEKKPEKVIQRFETFGALPQKRGKD